MPRLTATQPARSRGAKASPEQGSRLAGAIAASLRQSLKGLRLGDERPGFAQIPRLRRGRCARRLSPRACAGVALEGKPLTATREIEKEEENKEKRERVAVKREW